MAALTVSGRPCCHSACGMQGGGSSSVSPVLPRPSTMHASLHPGPAAGWQGAAACQARHQRLPPCRVTNTSDEIYRAMKQRVPDGEPEEELMVSELQVHNPELGILENRVGKFYLQELFQDSGVDLEETAYWFHTPPGGWNTTPVRVKAAEEAPVTWPEPQHTEIEGSGRMLLGDLEEGQVITGVITDCWFYHGIQIDFGAEFDGLVAVKEDTWMEEGVREVLLPGEEVHAVVHKVRQPGLYRWPVELQLLQPSWVASLLPHPDTYRPPINHEWCDEQGWGVEEINQATGRMFEGANYLIPEEQASAMVAMEQAYGFDDPESNVYPDNPKTDFIMGPGQDMVLDIMADVSMP